MDQIDFPEHEIALEHLKRCDELLEECNMILDTLEGILESTPKPSEHLGWEKS